MEKLMKNRAQLQNKKFDINDRRISAHLKNRSPQDVIKSSDYLKDSKLELTKDSYHSFVLKFGQILWETIDGERTKETEQRLCEIEQMTADKFLEEKNLTMKRSRELIMKEIENEKELIERKWNMKLQSKISKIEDEMAVRTEIALKEQKDKLTKLFEKKVQLAIDQSKQDEHEKLEKMEEKLKLQHQEEMNELRRNHKLEKKIMKENSNRDHEIKLSLTTAEFEEKSKQLEEEIKCYYLEFFRNKSYEEEKRHRLIMEKLETKIYEKEKLILELKSQHSKFIEREKVLTKRILLLKKDFDHYIQTTLKCSRSSIDQSQLPDNNFSKNQSEDSFLLRTPKEIIQDPMVESSTISHLVDPMNSINKKDTIYFRCSDHFL